jgi:hypothetical protein
MEELLRKRDTYQVPNIAIAFSYKASTSVNNLAKGTFWHWLFMVKFVWKISFIDFHEALLLWEESKIAHTAFSVYGDHSVRELTTHKYLILKWAQHSPYELYTRPKSSKRYSLKWSYVHKVWKVVLYQKWLEHNLPKGWDHRRQLYSEAIGYWLTNG